MEGSCPNQMVFGKKGKNGININNTVNMLKHFFFDVAYLNYNLNILAEWINMK